MCCWLELYFSLPWITFDNCIPPRYPPAGLALSATVTATLAGTLAAAFTFDAPALTSLLPGNAPSALTAVLTVLGSGFGGADATPSLRVVPPLPPTAPSSAFTKTGGTLGTFR